jgi:cell division protein FtsB
MKLKIKLCLTAIINIQNGYQHNHSLQSQIQQEHEQYKKYTAGVGVIFASCYTNSENPVY